MYKFPEILKNLRKEKNLSFEALAKETGLSSSSLCRWENNQSDINVAQLIVLADYFGVSLDYLMGRED